MVGNRPLLWMESPAKGKHFPTMNVMRFQRNVAASETIALRGYFGGFLADYDGVDADDRCNIGVSYIGQ